MTTHRMLPPSNVQQRTQIINGRTYVGVTGTAYDIADFDAAGLSANGWIDCGVSGPTSARPSSAVAPNPLFVGCEFIDTTVNAVLRFDGASWRNVITGASA
jgi:hypothetical protein